MAIETTKRRFTVDEFERMAVAGILPEHNVELIEGEVVLVTIGMRHMAAVDRATRAMILAAGERAIVRIQGSVRLNLFNQPQPDIVLLRPRDDFYASRHASVADILLIVEVSDSSLTYDRDVKGPLYASLGVREYWISDLNERVLTCYSAPLSGVYENVRHFHRGDAVAAQLLPECAVRVDDLLAD